MSSQGRVAGKVALVTGGAGGIGAAICKLLAAEGASVVCADISEPRSAAIVEDIQRTGGEALPLVFDVADDDAWEGAIDQVREHYGQLDILINNAHYAIAGSIPDTNIEDWLQNFPVTAHGVFLGMKHGLALMSPGGSIINTCSVAAYAGYSFNPGYSAAKGAVRAMSRSAAIDCAQRGTGIRVNIIVPGFIRTRALDGFVALMGGESKQAAEQDLCRSIPLGEPGEPEDVAYAMLYLASDESRYVTGTEIVVDGGFLAQ